MLLSDFGRPIFKVLALTKLVERCFIGDLALVSSPEVACGFRYDSNHREGHIKICQKRVSFLGSHFVAYRSQVRFERCEEE